MTAYGRRGSLSAVLLLAGLALAGGIVPRTALGVTPDSPEVRKVIDKGFEFLTANTDGRLGGKCLIGLAFLKDGHDESHARIAEAVKACQNATRGDAASINPDIYSTGIAIIFLCSLDPSKYSTEILKLQESLERRQKPHGGWGYADRETGDTSMTQYGVLAYWEMSKVGYPTSLDSTERVANWLLRTQDPGGSWGYQGKEAEGRVRVELVKQDSARPGMAAASLGATYMCADLLGLGEVVTQRDESLPPSVRAIRKAQPQNARTRKVDIRQVKAAQSRGQEWMKKNYTIDTPSWNYYYLYALERYQSFLEAAEGRVIQEPRWYNEGFAFLKKEQQDNGSWKDTNENLEAVNTAFAVLFLLRSTKKAIEKSKSYGEGALLVGRGLPADPQEVRIRGQREIVARESNRTVGELLDVLAQPTHPEFKSLTSDGVYLAEQIGQESAESQGALLAQVLKLARSGAADARLAAVGILGELRDLESAVTLIAALDDEDWRVVQAADAALARTGRAVAPSSLAAKPSPQSRGAAIARWKAWYASVRPDAQFEN
jgi:hypothetical protein